MKKFFKSVLLITLAMLMLIAPMEAFAASTVKIYRVNADFVRIHSSPAQGLDNVVSKVHVGTKVFYTGKSTGGWMKVRTQNGVNGYIYRDYLTYYGATTTDRVYKASSRTYIYKKASTSSTKLDTLKSGEYCIVYATKGNWCAVATLSGLKGYVRKSALSRAK